MGWHNIIYLVTDKQDGSTRRVSLVHNDAKGDNPDLVLAEEAAYAHFMKNYSKERYSMSFLHSEPQLQKYTGGQDRKGWRATQNRHKRRRHHLGMDI